MKLTFKPIAIGLSITAPALAIFGLGDVVFDPTSFGELVSQLGQMEQQYTQLVKTYGMITSQYNQMLTDAKMITSKTRWRAFVSPWTFPSASNTYGTTGGWISALNSGSSAASGYAAAVTPIRNYAAIWGSIDLSQQDLIGRNYANVELSDGVTVNALHQLGAIRGNTSEVEAAINSLEADSLSDSDALNTEVGVLNKVNAAAIINVRNSQDTNKLLAAMLDQQTVAAKSQRDAQAQSINNDIALRQTAPAVDDQHLAGATQVLTTYRIP